MTTKQRAHLRSLAHDLKPLVHIGKEGVTVAAIRSTREAFNTRELLKVRVLDMAPVSAREAAHALAAEIDESHVVQVVGHVAVLYRPHPDKPQIKLPK